MGPLFRQVRGRVCSEFLFPSRSIPGKRHHPLPTSLTADFVLLLLCCDLQCCCAHAHKHLPALLPTEKDRSHARGSLGQRPGTACAWSQDRCTFTRPAECFPKRLYPFIPTGRKATCCSSRSSLTPHSTRYFWSSGSIEVCSVLFAHGDMKGCVDSSFVLMLMFAIITAYNSYNLLFLYRRYSLI